MKTWTYVLLVAAMTLGAHSATAATPSDTEISSLLGGGSSSGGSLVNAVGTIFKNPSPTAVQYNTRNTVESLFTAAQGGDKGALSLLNGTFSGGQTTVGAATGFAIGATGGVVANRQNSLLAERKALGGVDAALAAFAMNQECVNRLWASPFHVRQEMDDTPGYDGYTYRAWGASVGYDRAFGNFFAGGVFTYSSGDYDQNNLADDNATDNYGFSLYGQYYNPERNIFATLTAGYNYGDNDWNASAGGVRATGSNHTGSHWFGGVVGQEFVLPDEYLVVTPSIGLFWSRSESSAYSSGAWRIGKMESESLLMPIDVKVEHTKALSETATVTFTASAGYAYNWKGDDSRVRGTYSYAGYESSLIMMQGPGESRNSWNIGGGVTYRKNNVDVGLNYRYDMKNDFSAHRIAATVGWSF